jgi:DNA invertase Pin-like site-specific DNA recombinase
VKAAAYARVSTVRRVKGGESDERVYDQNPAIQEHAIREMVQARGWELSKVYTDRASGAKERRPALDELMTDARAGKFSVVVVWRYDRFARSVMHLISALNEFRLLGIDFVSLREGIDTRTPTGRAMFGMIATFAELERELIIERVNAGIAHSKVHGTKSGLAAGGQRRVWDRGKAEKLRQRGMSWRAIARELSLPVSTIRGHFGGVRRTLSEMAKKGL